MATFAVNASLIYALLACVVALWRLTKSSWVKLDFQLMIDHNDGADLLAVFATMVIALNVAAWWPRSVNTQPRPADAVPDRDEHETQAALYARYLTLSQAALLSGFGAIAVGEASFVHAVVVKGELLTGLAILLVAMVIAVFSLDAQAGLLEGKDLEDKVRRDRRDADLERLRQLVGQAQEGSPTLDNPLARWSDARTAARWSGSAARLWWLSEVVGIAAVMLVVPTIGLTYASRRDGYSWSQIAGTVPPARTSVRHPRRSECHDDDRDDGRTRLPTSRHGGRVRVARHRHSDAIFRTPGRATPRNNRIGESLDRRRVCAMDALVSSVDHVASLGQESTADRRFPRRCGASTRSYCDPVPHKAADGPVHGPDTNDSNDRMEAGDTAVEMALRVHPLVRARFRGEPGIHRKCRCFSRRGAASFGSGRMIGRWAACASGPSAATGSDVVSTTSTVDVMLVRGVLQSCGESGFDPSRSVRFHRRCSFPTAA
ncbi:MULTISPECIES: hypothetical protein [Nocardia]|uniref:Uncharacterized protein n=1 Tax=Nocardia thailandica TaxID=257275 RepID=A0ABW6PW41_9NOCA|nr:MULTISPECIES: hypothetical protein [Nocardia]